MFLTQMVTDHKVSIGESGMKDQWQLQELYGTLWRSMLSIYETLSEGTHWASLLDPLYQHVSPFLSLGFVVYSAFALFAVMNIMTGVFVDLALRCGEEERKHILIRQARDFCNETELHSDGTITREEFISRISGTIMEEFLKEIDLSPEDAELLFDLLDVEQLGRITPEDLICGCLRLKGTAKALDLMAYLQDYRVWTGILTVKLESIEDSIRNLALMLHGGGGKSQDMQQFLNSSVPISSSVPPIPE